MNPTTLPNDYPTSQANERLNTTTTGRTPSSSQEGAGQPFIRIPCRARGVCGSHTPDTAYFDIPVDCQHGTMLQCSYPACRDSERWFRYCKVCDTVVAKRNFSKRHGHLIPRYPADEVATSSDDSVSSTDSKRRKLSDRDSLASTRNCTIAPDGVGVGNEQLSMREEADVLTGTTNDMLVPISHQRTVFTSGETPLNPPMLMMMVSLTEATMIHRIRSEEETMKWNQEILAAREKERTSSDDDYLPDDQGEIEELPLPVAPAASEDAVNSGEDFWEVLYDTTWATEICDKDLYH